MLKYTRENLLSICKKYIQNDAFCNAVALPELLDALIIHLWTRRIELETEEEYIVRTAYEYLSNEGCFNFQE